MFRRVPFLLFLLLMASCNTPAVTEMPSAFTAEQPTLEPTTQALLPDTPTPTQTPLPALTPTETSLPPLALPTEIPSAPSLLAWDGVPTYLGDSQPGYAFRVFYNPDRWALTQDQFGFPALAHRAIPYCVISVTSGRGLPPNVSVEQDILYTPTITFYVGTAYENGTKKFVTYTGGDGVIFTAFQVSFEEQSDQCLAEAETVLTTLRSVLSFQATPTP